MWKNLVHKIESAHVNSKLSGGSFSWGIEYLTSDEVKDPAKFLSEFTKNAIENSDDFFSFMPIRKILQQGSIISFSAPISYPNQNEINKTTFAHYYPVKNARAAIIVVPHWCSSPESYESLCGALVNFGFSTVRLTLPYHQERGLADWEMKNDFVSANIGNTIQGVRQAVAEVRALAHWLKEQGHENIGVFGSSIGSCISLLADAVDQNINSFFAMHISSWFGDVVWTGLSTQHIKRGIENNLTQAELRQAWLAISPMAYIKKLEGANPHHFMLTGRHDLTFLYHLTDLLFQEYHKYNIPFDYRVLPAGHFTFRYGPLKYYTFALILKHFKNTL